MARKKIEENDDDNLDDFDDEILDQAAPESAIDSALIPHDYSSRKVLVLELDDSHRALTIEVLEDLLAGATIKSVRSVEEAIKVMDLDEWDTFVVDLQEPGVSSSNFVKRINNLPDAMLVAISYQTIVAGEVRNRFKMEPWRKLFDIEKVKPKAA